MPYLARLGVTHCYASPYLKARAGSTHGYDVIDHNSLNPEVGTEADYQAWVAALQAHGMSHILDTVPNHAGVGTNDNLWWNDVLEDGPASQYAGCFDITWDGSSRRSEHGKLLLPILGEHYGKALEAGQLKVVLDAQGLGLTYYDRRLPLSIASYQTVLEQVERVVPAADRERVRKLMGSVEQVASAVDRASAKTELKTRVAAAATSPPLQAAFHEALQALNGKPGEAASFDELDRLLALQHYRLAFWRVAPDEINYRRFFDINDLAALSMERPAVFDAAHRLTFSLLQHGKVAGLRIDHPDGLLDPQEYLARLQRVAVRQRVLASARGHSELAGLAVVEVEAEVDRQLADWPLKAGSIDTLPLYVTVEKILAADEPMPRDWPCHGTSGYDFLVLVNGLFVDPRGEAALTEAYEQITGNRTALDDLIYEKKKLILTISLASELRMLAERLDDLASRDRYARDFTLSSLRDALREVIACFPVYRSYVSPRGVSDTDVRRVQQAVVLAKRRSPGLAPSAFDFIENALLLRTTNAEREREEYLAFAGRFQQLTAPATAKGIEDTAFYLYNRLISLNEVGGEPAHFGTSAEALHSYLAERQRYWPHALSPLSTHDTKRSEDVRARIHVLSEIPERWSQHVRRWMSLNEHALSPSQSHGPVPGPNEQYLFFQTLLGVWPAGGGPEAGPSLVERVQAYMLKATREAKQFTRWTDPDAAYEKAVERYIAVSLDPARSAAFLNDFAAFARLTTRLGQFNSLSQTLLRLTAPGVPDTYQGTELLDLSLVDPDNRRPVDYGHRQALLSELPTDLKTVGRGSIGSLLDSPEDGRLKLWMTAAALRCRREHPGLFSTGSYVPLSAVGRHARNVFAFARRDNGRLALVVVSRFTADLLGLAEIADVPEKIPAPTGEVWRNTALELPTELGRPKLRNVLTGERLVAELQMEVSALLPTLPVGLWLAETA